MQRSIIALRLLFPLVGFVCGNRRPAILNTTDSSIEVRAVYSDGSSSTAHLEPGMRLFLGDPPRYPCEVKITLSTGQQFSYSSANAPELLGAPPNGSTVGWKVSTSGVTPLTEQDLR